MLEWIKTWTFFNWLTLIAFVFGTISVLNATLSLRSRYKDWQATKSKEAFEKRLEQLKQQISRIRKIRESTITLATEVMIYIIGASVFFLFAFICSVILLLNISIKTSDEFLLIGLTISFFLLIATSIAIVLKLFMVISYVRTPWLLESRTRRLVNRGKSKGLIPKDDDSLTNTLLKAGVSQDMK